MGRTITMSANPLLDVDEDSCTYVVPELPWDVVLAARLVATRLPLHARVR